MKIIYLNKTTSTEDYVKKRLKKQQKTREDLFVIAKTQTGGRGTKGRSFSSQEGGLYLSFLHFYDNFPAKEAFNVNKAISMAVVKTLLSYGVKSGIKWPNDVYAEGKKICGMLITNAFTGESVDYTITGIGVNVNNDLPKDLSEIATSVKAVLGKQVDLKSVTATLIYNLLNPEKGDLYARYSIVLGKKVKVIPLGGEPYFSVAKEILPDGRLKLINGTILTAEEVSLRLDDNRQ